MLLLFVCSLIFFLPPWRAKEWRNGGRETALEGRVLSLSFREIAFSVYRENAPRQGAACERDRYKGTR